MTKSGKDSAAANEPKNPDLQMVDQASVTAKNVLQLEIALISTIKTLSDLSNKAVLHQQYVVEGRSINEIAELLGVTKSAVFKKLKKFKIPRRASHQNHGRCRNPRFGYHFLRGNLVENRKEQRIIKEVVAMYLNEKLPLNAIAKRLTKQNIATKKGKTQWRHDRVKDILTREGVLK